MHFPGRALLILSIAAAGLLAVAYLRGSGPAEAVVDPSGDWNITLAGDIEAECEGSFLLEGSGLSALWECTGGSEGTLTGDLQKDKGGAEFTLGGTILIPPTLAIAFEAEGEITADGLTMDGTWEAPDLETEGTLTGSRKGAFPTSTPPGPTNTPAAGPTTTPPPAPTDTPGPSQTKTQPPVTVSATPSPIAPAGDGDANCDGSTNSIDAAVLLQFGAALLQSIPCAGSADVNGDGMLNSLDAAIILQFVAGLIPGLPI